jgi:hypothetical protein
MHKSLPGKSIQFAGTWMRKPIWRDMQAARARRLRRVSQQFHKCAAFSLNATTASRLKRYVEPTFL